MKVQNGGASSSGKIKSNWLREWFIVKAAERGFQIRI